MMLRETDMQIKVLAREGMPKATIARRLGVSRQTVYNHLNREGPYPAPRRRRGSKLDAFKEYIETRLEAFDLPATTLYREIHKQGYEGGLTILREFIRPLKTELTRRVTERFETIPGRQAQIDWGECGTIDVDGERKKLYVFVMVLGYSRMLYARFTTSSKLPVLLDCLLRAFGALGIPSEVVVDNMKQAVDRHEVSTGTVRWNKTFLDFAEHHGFLPVATPPYWPRAKGKVERGVGYVKRSFLEGRAFTDLDDLNAQLAHWLDTVANVRIHGTTGERPVDRHPRELEMLRDAAAVPAYDTRPVEIRKVAPDCHISYRGVRYSVPPEAVGHSVVVRPGGERVGAALEIRLGDRILTHHRIHPKGRGRVTLFEHQAAIEAITRGRRPGGRRSSGPRFEQIASNGPSLFPRLRLVAPVVETRPLAVYEELLEAAVS